MLLENGADIEGAGYGVSPLHQAVKGAHEAVVKILLEKGADFNAVYDADDGNGYGDTVLHYAAKMKNKDLFTLVLEKGADWTKKNYNKDTVLHRVAEYGYMKGIRALMEKGASISARNYDLKTPTQLAKRESNDETLNLMLTMNAEFNINRLDRNGETRLTRAAADRERKDRRKVGEMFLMLEPMDLGFDIVAVIRQVQISIETKKAAAIAQLLEKGTNVS